MRHWWVLAPVVASALTYDVEFTGIQDDRALCVLQGRSELVSLACRPPPSINGLRYRIARDTPQLIEALHAFAYYDASIEPQIIEHGGGAYTVTMHIRVGPRFALKDYRVVRLKGERPCAEWPELSECCPLTPETLGLELGSPAISSDIINAELAVLTELSRCGHPLAYIDKRRVIVDMADHTVEAAACVEEGPQAIFGPVTMHGLQGVRPAFIERKIGWQEGCLYDSDLIEATQERLLRTELFSSVFISHGDTLDASGALPIRMRMTEATHRSLSLGAFYATVDGPGLSFSWVHRNVRGLGETVSLSGDVSTYFVTGNITYKKPDFIVVDQTYRALGEVMRQNINPFLAFTYRIANYLDRIFVPYTLMSMGLKLEQINVHKSATNGSYLLVGLPLFGRYDRSNDMLNPTRGYTIAYSITPYQSAQTAHVRFAKQRLTLTLYAPLGFNDRLSLALRAQFGSIAGAARRNVPLPKLFLGGSEENLRGYRYKTVSPLNADRKPLGGRSAIFTSAELRIQVTEKIGLVPFADFGVVSDAELPTVTEKWFKSVGGGLRYFAFFGPLRFDVGVPLDRRRGIDPKFQVYASVGQAF